MFNEENKNNQFPYSNAYYGKHDDFQATTENALDCKDNVSGMPLPFIPFDFEAYRSDHLFNSGSDSPNYEDTDDDMEYLHNYRDHIDNLTDSSNGFLIKRYIPDGDGYITTLVLMLMIINFIHEDNLDALFIMRHAREIFVDKFELSEEEFQKHYLEKVAKAISDVEHMLYAIRYKGLNSDSSYSNDLTYTILGNIFANSEFNPYPDIFERTKSFYELNLCM